VVEDDNGVPSSAAKRRRVGDKPEQSREKAELDSIPTTVSYGQVRVAIFCALPEETKAVLWSLDEQYTCEPKDPATSKFVFWYGRIKQHTIVVAQAPQMGPINAAHCASDVAHQFPNVRFALMVGIGGGIPGAKDIRLGDVAVSVPSGTCPGVVQYDLGKFLSNGEFELKGVLNKPPRILLAADNAMQVDEDMRTEDEKPSVLAPFLEAITQKSSYGYPGSTDILYDVTFSHAKKGQDCGECETSSERKIVNRPSRSDPQRPVVHRGVIMSGGGVVKDAEARATLRREREDAICFEMEAAGIMDEIPCLVVRGICDYADTHKQDGWHNYAAAVAAAYAKALLLRVPAAKVEAEEKIADIMNSLSSLA